MLCVWCWDDVLLSACAALHMCFFYKGEVVELQIGFPGCNVSGFVSQFLCQISKKL